MATKKKKPTPSEFNTIDVESAVSADAQEEKQMTEFDKIRERAGTVGISVSEDIKQKLNSIDVLADENAKYAKIVSELQDRIAEYIQEVQDLKAQISEIGLYKRQIAEYQSEISKLKDNLAKSSLKPQQNINATQQQRINQIRRRTNQITQNCYRRRIIGEYPSWN